MQRLRQIYLALANRLLPAGNPEAIDLRSANLSRCSSHIIGKLHPSAVRLDLVRPPPLNQLRTCKKAVPLAGSEPTLPLIPSLILLAVFLTTFVSVPAWSQSEYGSLTGRVTDPAGAVIAGASISLVNVGTNKSSSGTTSGSGDFIFADLIPGYYELDVQKDKYRRFIQKAVVVRVQTTIRVDVALQLGQVFDSVVVSSKPEVLQSESSSLASIIEGSEVQEAPLNGRNVMNLVTLVPGVVAGGASQGNGAVISAQGWGNYQFSGAISNQEAVFFDGVLLNTNYANQPALIPSQDLVREFSVSTNSTSAEYGNTAGGVVNLASRSGTNQFHGSVFEFLRNKVLNANLFFNKRTNTPRPAFTQISMAPQWAALYFTTGFSSSEAGRVLHCGKAIATSAACPPMPNEEATFLHQDFHPFTILVRGT